MTIVAAQDPPVLATWAPADQAPSLTPASSQDEDGEVAERAQRLTAAIEHHRTETRRLLRTASQHRATLAELIAERDRHAVELRKAGWRLAPIARLYRLTRERVRQIIAASTYIDTDDGEGVA